MSANPCASTVTYLFTRWEGHIQRIVRSPLCFPRGYQTRLSCRLSSSHTRLLAATCTEGTYFLRRAKGWSFYRFRIGLCSLPSVQTSAFAIVCVSQPPLQSHYSPFLAPQYAPEDVILHAHGPVHAQDPTGTLIAHKDWVCISGV